MESTTVARPTLTLIFMCCAGYEEFLESRVAEEVTNLPRGIYHSSLSRQHLANHSKALTALPAFLAHEYERNKQPAMRPPLARKTCLLRITYIYPQISYYNAPILQRYDVLVDCRCKAVVTAIAN